MSAQPDALILEAKNLHAAYGETKVLHGIDFAVRDGGVSALLGANGAGKTTTLRAICGMVKTPGEIRFAGERIDGRATEDVARRGVAHVPDGRGTFLELTVEENLRLGAYTRRDRNVAADFDRMFGYFPRLRERFRQQAGTLSGGEQQMLAIARGLMAEPRLIILDEPSLGLMPTVTQELFRLIETVNRGGVGVLLVEQNLHQTLRIVHRGYVLEKGEVVLAGSGKDLLADPYVQRAFLGR
jgi:branched-chain amino acid transport system ATP-binding protein